MDRQKTGQFKPGKSGNPGGRPRRTKAQQEALEGVRALAPQAPAVLASIMLDDTAPPAQRLKAVEIVLERTYGKAEASVKVEETTGDVLAEIRAEVEQIRKEAGFGEDDL